MYAIDGTRSMDAILRECFEPKREREKKGTMTMVVAVIVIISTN